MQLTSLHLNRLVFFCSIGVFFVFLFFRIVFIFHPHPSAAGVDNNVVYFIQRLLDGGRLYTKPGLPPFAISQYSPLYSYCTAGVCRIAGVGPDDVLQIFEVSKIFSLFLNLLLCGVMFLTGTKIFLLGNRKSWFLALLTFIFIEGNSFARPDSLEHLFFILSLFFFFLSVSKQEAARQNRKELVLSAVVAVLALFSKQSAVTLPLICLLWMLIQRDGRNRIFIYALTYTISVLTLLAILHFSTGIKEMYQNAVLGLDNGIQWGEYWVTIIINFYSWFGCLWVLCFIFVYFLLRKEKSRLFHFLAFALLLQFIFTNLFALKYGATSNYFTNWWTLLFIGILLSWDRFSAIAGTIHRYLSTIVVLSFLFLKTALIVFPLVDKIRTIPQRTAFFEQEKQLANQVHAYADSPGKIVVFCNLFSPDSYLNNILFREAIVPQYDVVSLATYPRKVFNYELLRKNLADGSVRVVITKKSNNPLKFMDIELSHYVLEKKIGEYSIYLYNNPPHQK
jgi:hypothetical protein